MMDETHSLKERKYKQNNSIRVAPKIEKYTAMEPDYMHARIHTHLKHKRMATALVWSPLLLH